MTTLTLFRSGGRLSGFEALGHTDYAQNGEDIVCAGISALTQAALMGIREHLKLPVAWEMEDGYLYCMLASEVEDPAWHDAEIILETMALGLRSLAETYATFIKLIEREV